MVPLFTCPNYSRKAGAGILTNHPVEFQTKVIPKALAMQLPWTAKEATYPNIHNLKWLDPLLDHYSYTTKDSQKVYTIDQ